MSAEIQAQFNEVMREIEAKRQLETLRTQQANQAAEDLYRRSVGDANHVYDQTGAYVGEQNTAIENLFKTSIADNKQANQGLAATLAGLSQQTASGAGNELSRLGIQQSGMGTYLQDAGLNESLSAQQSASEQSNLKLSNQGAVEVGKLLAGMNEGQRGSVLGNVLVTRDNTFKTNNDALAMIQQELASQQLLAQRKRDEMLALYAQQQAAARRRSSYSRGRSGGGGGGGGGKGKAVPKPVKSQNIYSTLTSKAHTGSPAERLLSELALNASGKTAYKSKRSTSKLKDLHRSTW